MDDFQKRSTRHLHLDDDDNQASIKQFHVNIIDGIFF